MCTRFVCNGKDTVTGFNFEIDLAVWNHKIIREKDRFYIGIKMPDGIYHSFHGVHRNGNVGTLLYVHGNEAGSYGEGPNCRTIAELTEQFVRGELTYDEALRVVQTEKIVYAPDSTMQAMLSDKDGRVLIVEPGIGYREEKKRWSLMTNYSVLEPETTRPFLVPGDDRYERAQHLLESCGGDVSGPQACSILREVRQEGIWATRVSFVYAVKEQKVYYVVNNEFEDVIEYSFGV